jgi:hypothetical protein
MNISELFNVSIKEMRAMKCSFAVGGGFAADLYRHQARGTADIDYLFLVEGDSEEVGKKYLSKLNLSAAEVRLHQLTRSPRMNKKSQDIFILVGRAAGQDAGVDLLLPSFPWFQNALERAQHHLVDFGFGPTPTITVEDCILAKTFASRPKDIDDILSIFEAGHPLDLAYLTGELERLQMRLPEEAKSLAPKALRVFSKRKKRQKKSFP